MAELLEQKWTISGRCGWIWFKGLFSYGL